MTREEAQLREAFETLFAEWERAIEDPQTRLSSRPQDYLDNEPYRQIVQLGERALPFIMEKLDEGAFLLNQAAVEITGLRMEDFIGMEQPFPSEQEKASLLVQWWEDHHP